MKTCNTCGISKPKGEFNKRAARRDGLQAHCRPCGINKCRTRRESRPPTEEEIRAKRWYDVETKTGWTEAQSAAAWESQHGKCAVCSTDMLPTGRVSTSMTHDHCHAKNTPRALLCNRCNKALGQFGDDIELMERAVTYLKHHQ